MSAFILSPELREQLKQRSHWRGLIGVARDWGLVFIAFAIAIAWPNPVTWMASVLLLSAAHLGFAVLTHEAAHRSLCANARVNDWVGHYLCALPNFNHMGMYRTYHMKHHRTAGTPEDPDLVMVRDYPIARARLWRRLLRDLRGQSGVKFLIGSIGMTAEFWVFQQNGLAVRKVHPRRLGVGDYIGQFLRNGGGWSIGWQCAIWGALWGLGHGWLYLLWVVAYLVPFPFFLRLRLLADHAAVQDALSADPRDHARSTEANWIEKLLLVPHNEHYHLEHHLVPSAPYWQLPSLHAILVRDGAIPPANRAAGFRDVLRRVTT